MSYNMPANSERLELQTANDPCTVYAAETPVVRVL